MGKVYDGIIGLATGDALGVPVEFRSRQELAENPVVSMREYGTHHQPAGTWSDDTSLTLALMDSMIEENGINPADMMERFSGWLMYGDYTATGEVFDVGSATRSAIMNYGHGTDPLKCGGISEYENGNGSLMRILPVAYYLEAQPDATTEFRMETVHKISSLTHRHPVSLIGCGLCTGVALKLLSREESLYASVEQGLKETFACYELMGWEDLHAYARLENLAEFSELPETEIRSGGYVVDTLEAALWCLLNSTSYGECVLKAVNLGNDTDTVGAVAGGLAGMYYGAGEIPDEWLNTLKKREYIESICEKFLAFCTHQ